MRGNARTSALYQSSRRRRIPLAIFEPRAAPRAGLVLFSHGTRVPLSAYDYLYDSWCRMGYVVIALHHRGRTEESGSAEGLLGRNWDSSFVLDAIESGELRLEREIDWSRVCFAGHSHGAHAALIAGGGRCLSGSKKTLSARDARIKAIIAICPPIARELKFARYDCRGIRCPLLLINGEDDIPLRGSLQQRFQAFQESRSASKSHFVIPGAWHEAFMNGISLQGATRSFRLPSQAILKQASRLTSNFLSDHFGRDS